MTRPTLPASILVIAWSVVAAVPLAAQGACSAQWASGLFNLPGLGPGSVAALKVFDDGSGPALYAGGDFTAAGSVLATGVAKWSGGVWSPLSVPNYWGGVKALEVFDDGTGPALYAAGILGAFPTGVAKWNGSAWTGVGSAPGLINADVNALAVFDDGGGPALYSAGVAFLGPGLSAKRVAKLQGGVWQPVGGSMLGDVFALCVHDDGAGPALYAAGAFTQIGGASVNLIAKWTGTVWSPLGAGPNGGGPSIHALLSFDDGTGPGLYAGGQFLAPSAGVARWNGTAWSGLGSGVAISLVRALTTFDDGPGRKIYATGYHGVARWDGGSWTAIDWTFSQEGHVLAEFNDGSGAALFCGGSFGPPGGTPAYSLARWNGAAWSVVVAGNGISGGFAAGVESLLVFDDGSGPALYAGGTFTHGGIVPSQGVAKWNGSSWLPLGTGVLGSVHALAVYDDGTGPALYVGGQFLWAGGVSAWQIAKWNGTSFSPLGGGIFGDPATVNALAVFDDGGGPALYAGGFFQQAGAVLVNGLAKWNGSSWSAVPTGPNFGVKCLLTFDDGTGPRLYAGGGFSMVNGVLVNGIARWDGVSWDSVTSGLANPGGSGHVYSMAAYDDGSGPALYAGGSFEASAWGPANHVARWNGVNWSGLGAGPSFAVSSLLGFDDGSGPKLYAGGGALTPANMLERWDGNSWSPVGTGLVGFPNSSGGGGVLAMAHFDDGTGPGLFAGGLIAGFGSTASFGLAKWAQARPSLTYVTQIGSVSIQEAGLVAAHEYYNIFSGEACGVVGSGPYLGLCASDPTFLVIQFLTPVGTAPFHFIASQQSASFGPYGVPSGVVLDGVCFDWTGGALGCSSVVRRVLVP